MTLARIDVHMHLAGTGCCNSGAWIAPKLRQRYTIKLLQWLHHISNYDMEHNFDCDWAAYLSKQVAECASIDYGVAFGFDGAYDFESGALNQKYSQMLIPVDWVFDVCRKHANLLPGPSLNPYRKDALEALDYCLEQKPVLIKWLPSAQAIDPGHPRLRPFYQRLVESNVPLLVHIGGERTFYSYFPNFNLARLMHFPLELGVKVICAHSGTKVLFSGEEDQLADVKQLLQRYPHFWLDNSGICNPSRFAHLPHLVRDPLLVERTLYGSDFPVPSNAVYYLFELGWKKVRDLNRINNTLERDWQIKAAFGYPQNTATRAHQVLANLDFWIKADKVV